jgi:glucose-1-phosphate adenylyltransferase
MDLISVIPDFNLYDPDWPLRTYQYQYPPAKTVSHEGERVGRTLNSLSL